MTGLMFIFPGLFCYALAKISIAFRLMILLSLAVGVAYRQKQKLDKH